MFLAAVGPLMTEVAGEVCDGFICHGFTTERYLREVTLPALERGRAKAGKTMERIRDLAARASSSPAPPRRRWQRPRCGTRQQIAFYGSTPAYRGVLELHGWGDLQAELNALSKQGRWEEMGELIDDEILDTFAVVGEPDQIAPELKQRYGDVVDAHQLLRAVPLGSRAMEGRARRVEGLTAGRSGRARLGRIPCCARGAVAHVTRSPGACRCQPARRVT